MTVAIGVDAAYASQFTRNNSLSGQYQIYQGSGGSPTIMGYALTAGNRYEFRLPGATSRNFYLQTILSWYDENNVPHSTISVGGSVITLGRRNVDAVSIDSRKTYGQPNLDGEQPGDPNADLRNVNFAGWSFKGGLFAGNAPAGTNDLSGTARIQGWVPSATFVQPLGSCWTLLSLGAPSKYSSTASYQGYIPSSSDPNIASSSSTVTWANAWSLTTATATGASLSLGTATAPEYANVQTPALPDKLFLALTPESTYVSGGYGAWQYFGTAAYEANFTTFPHNDSRSRVWTADLTSQFSVYYYSG